MNTQNSNYERITTPEIGDFIMELGSLQRYDTEKNNYPRRFGTLIQIKQDAYVIKDLTDRTTEWRRHNDNQTQFIVLPTDFNIGDELNVRAKI